MTPTPHPSPQGGGERPASSSISEDEARWNLAWAAAALLAVDPAGLGGIVLRGPVGPARDTWLGAFRALLPTDTPWRRVTPQIAEGRLLGGLDLAATLAAGRPVAERGLLVDASGGILLVPMAERLEASTAGHIAAALDTGEVVVERDSIALRTPTRFAAVLLDEGIDDERAPAALAERLAFALDLEGLRGAPTMIEAPEAPSTACGGPPPPSSTGEDARAVAAATSSSAQRGRGTTRSVVEGAADTVAISAARQRLPNINANDDAVAALAAAGLAFGVPSLRVATLALRAAKAAAALAGRDVVASEDAEIAAALVIAPRATTIPASDATEEPEAQEPPPPSDTEPQADDAPAEATEPKTMTDSVVEAARASIPAGLLATLSAAAGPQRQGSAGRAGVAQKSARRGRPAGVRRGAPGHGVRLAVVETLRAAAPWQKLRRNLSEGARAGVLVRREDFRVGRFKEKSESLTIFVVDASGSAALHRLAEAKGAVELVLAECYVRRDSVALIAFRGERAELVLPPTRSLARAKRALAGQPGGGGTPLATAIDVAAFLAEAARKRGQRPLVVLMTDGKANISRAGRPGRAEAEADATAAAQAFRLGGAAGLVLDIAPRPGDAAARLAAAMGARYIPLPYADAQLVSRAVMAAGPAAWDGIGR